MNLPKLEKRKKKSSGKYVFGFTDNNAFIGFSDCGSIPSMVIAQVGRILFSLGEKMTGTDLEKYGPDEFDGDQNQWLGGCQNLQASTEGDNTFWAKTRWPSIEEASRRFPDTVYRQGKTGVEMLVGLTPGPNTFWKQYDPFLNTEAVKKYYPPSDPRMVLRDTPISDYD